MTIVIIYKPRLNAKADEFKFSLPPDIKNYKALLRVAMPKKSTSNACVPANMQCIQKINGEFNRVWQVCCGDNSQYDYAVWKDWQPVSFC